VDRQTDTERRKSLESRETRGPGWSFPPFPAALVRVADVLRAAVGVVSYADREHFFAELSTFAYDLRRAGVPREKVVAAVWPLFIGITSPNDVEDALERCLSAYDVAPDSRPSNGSRRRPTAD
jgi:hypothetical protein